MRQDALCCRLMRSDDDDAFDAYMTHIGSHTNEGHPAEAAKPPKKRQAHTFKHLKEDGPEQDEDLVEDDRAHKRRTGIEVPQVPETELARLPPTMQTATAVECRPAAEMEQPLVGSYRPDVDGLRAVAVVAVILFHFDASWLPGGFVGVDVFFVISGFVVSGSLLRQRFSSSGAFLADFYARRLKRLSPALYVTILASSLAMSRWIPPYAPQLDGYYASGMLALVGWANVHYASMPTGYFETGAEGLEFNPFTHCWSLGVEEQFYLLFPLLLLACYHRRVSAGCQGHAHLNLPPLGAILVLATAMLASFGYSMWLTAVRPTAAYFLLPSRFWQLMVGALLTSVLDRRRGAPFSPPVRVTILIDIVAVVLLVVAFTCTPNNTGFPTPWSLVGVSGAVSVIASGCITRRRLFGWFHTPFLPTILSYPSIVYLGKISYPLYLFHWPVLVIFRWTDTLLPWENRCAAFVIMMAGAMFLYHVVEAPFRKWRPKRRVTVFMAAGVLLALSELWLGLNRGPLFAVLFPKAARTAAADAAILSNALHPWSPSPLPPQSQPPNLPPSPQVPPSSPSPPRPPADAPRRPPSPTTPPPPYCAGKSSTGVSVYTDRHPAFRLLDEAHDPSHFSTFPERGCKCARSTAALHVPPCAVDDAISAAAPPCFLPALPSQQPRLGQPRACKQKRRFEPPIAMCGYVSLLISVYAPPCPQGMTFNLASFSTTIIQALGALPPCRRNTIGACTGSTGATLQLALEKDRGERSTYLVTHTHQRSRQQSWQPLMVQHRWSGQQQASAAATYRWNWTNLFERFVIKTMDGRKMPVKKPVVASTMRLTPRLSKL